MKKHILVASAVVGMYLALLAANVQQVGGWYPLIGLKDHLVDSATLVVPCESVSTAYGYDGIAFFRLALDPLTHEQTDYGIVLTHPGYRQQRIAYPALAWVFGQGSPARTLAALIIVNLVCVFALSMLGSRIAEHFGYAGWMGALFALGPGLSISVSRLLSEPLAHVMMVATLWYLIRRRFLAAALTASIAVLTRETMVIVVGAWTLTWLLQRKTHPAAPWWLLPGAIFTAWQAWLWMQWGMPASAASGQSPLPLVGIVKSVGSLTSALGVMEWFFLGMMGCLIGWIAMAGRYAMKADVVSLSFWLLVALYACLSPAIWNNSPSFMRVCATVFPLGLILMMRAQATARHVRLAGIAIAALWMVCALAEIYRYRLVAPTLWDACPAATVPMASTDRPQSVEHS